MDIARSLFSRRSISLKYKSIKFRYTLLIFLWNERTAPSKDGASRFTLILHKGGACKMKYKTLGKTGLDVSVLSFGASSLGSVFRETNEGESIQTVHATIDAGINYIDVSPYYGLTKAEAVLGKALKEIPRDKFLLSTKQDGTA